MALTSWYGPMPSASVVMIARLPKPGLFSQAPKGEPKILQEVVICIHS